MIVKPGKDPHEPSSYRPISLLPAISKLFEQLLLTRLKPYLHDNDLTPHFQFGFRQGHSTIEQVHRLTEKIHTAFETKQFCSAAFLDIAQAFDKVWHSGLLYKIKINLPHPYFLIIKSFLTNRYFQIKYHSVLSSFHSINSGVPQGSVLSPFLYNLYTSDFPTMTSTMTATFADDTAILATDLVATGASEKLQNHLDEIHIWSQNWRIKINGNKSSHITFTLKQETCPAVNINGNIIPQTEDVKYLGIHLDRRLTWKTHIWAKRKQLGIKLRQLYWLIGRNSHLSLANKIVMYKAIIKPVWTYGIQLWGSASSSNIAIIQRLQSKILRIITNSPWYVSNEIIHTDLKMPTVLDEIRNYSKKYQDRLEHHQNFLAVNLLDNSDHQRRLKRIKILDLPFRQN